MRLCPIAKDSHLPQLPGHYLWYVLDLGYLRIGSVTIKEEPREHREKLLVASATHGMKKVPFYMYQSELGTPLVMYHDAHDGQPPKQEDGFPEVDSFVAYDFQALISGDKRCELARVAPASRAGGSTTAKTSRSPVSVKTVGPRRWQSTGPRYFGRILKPTWTSRSRLINAVLGGLATWIVLTTLIVLCFSRR
jgi:hypothetical protein